MGEFVYMEGAWDLQAVVRGCTNEASANIMDNPPSFFNTLSFEQDHDFLLSFPEIFETTTVFDELEDLYKPFYPPVLQPLSPETIVSSSISVPEEVKEPKKQQKQKQPRAQSDIAATSTRVVKSKKRKNQNKMVVQQVAEEGLLSDKWAWRKYGQKPIKGSPYPRSYYRCSSSKGCLARKQVERDPSDPRFFIVTYTAEHNHTQPTRRNSLAGISRNKYSTPKVVATDHNPQMTTETVLSPTTPLMASIADDHFAQQEKIKKEEEQMLEADESNETVMPDIIFSDELFPSLMDMEALFLDQ